jgi:hypothetical protein
MIVQALVLLAAILIVFGTITTSALLTAKLTLRQTALSASRTAMANATADFVAWARDQTKRHGSEGAWDPPPRLAPHPLCDDPRPICRLSTFEEWAIEGRSFTKNAPLQAPSPVPWSGLQSYHDAIAYNLAETIDEQRISATIGLRIGNANGAQPIVSEVQFITLRIFDAFPYAIVTARRDVRNVAGSIASRDGDTSGFRLPIYLGSDGGLNDNTVITVTLNCNNTTGFLKSQPSGAAFVVPVRLLGNQDWSYEAPCVPRSDESATPPPNLSDYVRPTEDLYETIPSNLTERWSKHSGDASNFSP